MRRPSIADLMILIALLAANFAILRFLLSASRGGQNWHYQLPAGFVPLADSFLLAVFLLLRRNRVSLRQRPKHEPGCFAVPFISTVALFLALVILSVFYAYESFVLLLRVVSDPAYPMFKSLTGVEVDMDTSVDRYVIGPIFLGVTLSAPPLIIALAVAAVWSRFKVVVTPRAEDSSAASPSSP
jgi:hypothetical protein